MDCTITIAVDFDGTIVVHDYPDIKTPVPKALNVLHQIQQKGHNIILFTMRSGKELNEAVNYLKENGINLFGINENPEHPDYLDSRKVFANLYIDDSAVGCPLMPTQDNTGIMVNWKAVRVILKQMQLI
jgi:ribonucleotide monophosphatase NagD (HAD superfamily)